MKGTRTAIINYLIENNIPFQFVAGSTETSPSKFCKLRIAGVMEITITHYGTVDPGEGKMMYSKKQLDKFFEYTQQQIKGNQTPSQSC